MLKGIKVFLSYSIKRQLFIIELCVFLVLAKLCIRLLPFSVLSKYVLKTQRKTAKKDLKEANQLTIQGINYFLHILTKHLPWNSVCLDQAVAARWMLTRRNIATKLYFGVMIDKNNFDTIAAHAWLMAGKHCVTGHGFEAYKVIHVY